jgi:DNA-binding CsgD family transcriptional regulator
MSLLGSEFSHNGLPLEVGELIDQAGLGLANWLDVSRLIVEFLPDAFCWINNQNRKTGTLNFAAISGLTQESISAYENHFCKYNPYNGVWDNFRAGEVISSEATIPYSVFRKTGYYNDFIAKCGDFQMGLGVKIDATEIDQFVMPIHFPMIMRETYEPIVRNLFNSIAGNLTRASEMNRLHGASLMNVISAAALTGKSGQVAFVVDFAMRPVEANEKASAFFSMGNLVSVRGGRIAVKHDATETWLRSTVTSLICGLPVANAKHVCETETDAWLFSVYRAPENDPRNVNRFFGVRQLALVTVVNLRKPEASVSSDIVLRHFKLTSAERRLCALLENDLTLSECADYLDISIETVRTQTKAILQKTGTNRQSELISLLLRAR